MTRDEAMHFRNHVQRAGDGSMKHVGFALSILFSMVCQVALPVSPCSADEPSIGNQAEVEAVLSRHCVRCHGPKIKKAELRLDELDRDFVNGNDAEHWQEVLNQVAAGEMPPKEALALPDADRQRLTVWIRSSLEMAATQRRNSSGRVELRRLTIDQYQQTMEDLLGFRLEFSKDLPPDSVSKDGFLNNGQTLFMAPSQVETYMEVARRALDISFDTVSADKELYYFVAAKAEREADFETWKKRTAQHEAHLERASDGRPAKPNPKYPRPEPVPTGHTRKTDRIYGNSHGGLLIQPISKEQYAEKRVANSRTFDGVPVSPGFRQMYGMANWLLRGELLVRVRAAGSGGMVKMTVSLGYRSSETILNLRPIGSVIVGDDEIFEFHARMENLPVLLTGKEKFHAELITIANDSVSTPLILDSVEIVFSPRSEATEHAVLDDTPEATLRKFVPRAWRRPISDEEIQGLLDLHRQLSQNEVALPVDVGRDPRASAALRDTLAAVLSSANFLYRTEPRVSGKEHALSDHELACRLSYFLWNTMPDAELRRIADAGELRTRLATQLARMLADAKSNRFLRSFVYQWLDLGGLDRVAVNPENFPEYTSELKADSAEETYALFDHILRQDLPATQLLKSDFVMLNDRMAQHYGVQHLTGSNFRPVPAPEHRGGLLSQASFLTANANGVDSHPVKRGTWILRRLLNDPPPPPPPNVPMLGAAKVGTDRLTIAQRLEQHRDNAACFDCHQKIDHWGLALENFDAIGKWRGLDTELDSNDIQRRLLDERKNQFAKAFTEKLMTYALGRSLDFSDSAAVDALAAEFVSSQYRIRKLIECIVLGETFQTK